MKFFAQFLVELALGTVDIVKMTIAIFFSLALVGWIGNANAQTHSGNPVTGDGVSMAHSSDGNIVSNNHMADGDVSMSTGGTDASTEVTTTHEASEMQILSAMPAFSQRGNCSGSEGSAQGGWGGAIFGFSWGTAETYDCETRHNLATLHELHQAGLIGAPEAKALARHALRHLKGMGELEYRTTVRKTGEHSETRITTVHIKKPN